MGRTGWLAGVFAGLGCCFFAGCSREFWRDQADRDSYELIDEKMNDPRWMAPRIDIEPDPRSRFYDPYDPDYSPLPPDDDAANALMEQVGAWKGYKSWHKFGRSFTVENPHWLENLYADAGEEDVVLQTSAIGTSEQRAALRDLALPQLLELSYIHSRVYQTELENVYLQALQYANFLLQ